MHVLVQRAEFFAGNHVNNGYAEDHTLKPWINTRSSVFLIAKSASRVSPCDNLESEDRQGSEMRLYVDSTVTLRHDFT